MRPHRDLIGFLDLATDLVDLQHRILQAHQAEQVVVIAREFGFFFTTDDLLTSRQHLSVEHWTWLSGTLVAGFWVES